MSKKRRQLGSKKRHGKATRAAASIAEAAMIASAASESTSASRADSPPPTEPNRPLAVASEVELSSSSPQAGPHALAVSSERSGPGPRAAAEPGWTADPDREEPSVPPMGDLDVVLFDSKFFDSEPAPLFFDAVADPFGPDFGSDSRAQRFSPEAVRRRAQLAKYVHAAVGFSIVLCLLALGKAGFVRGSADSGGERQLGRASAIAMAAPLNPIAMAVPLNPIATAAPLNPIDPGSGAAIDTTGAVASDVTAAAHVPGGAVAAGPSSPPDDVSPPAPVTAAVDGPRTGKAGASARVSAPLGAKTAVASDARSERERARQLLERGKVADAIAAAERATNLDGSDGEAWLILGAAYQERGDLRQARRCFRACAHEGVRGPRTECAQMLR